MNFSSRQNNFFMENSDEEEKNMNQLDWKYQDDPYQASGTSVKVVNQTFQLKKDLRFIQTKGLPSNIATKSEALFRYVNDMNFDRNFLLINQGNKSGESLISDRWSLENDKYIEYDCESDNSEDDEIDFQSPNCDDVMTIIETQRQDGEMYFVTKIVAPQNKEFKIDVQRIKGGGNDPVIVEILEKRDVYYLFKLSFTSQLKVFKIRLLLDKEVILETKPYNFSVERIEYNPGIAYDFVRNKKLFMSVFEGAIAASSFNIINTIDFFERSINKFQQKSKSYLNEEIELDEIFENFLNNQKSLQKWLFQFQLILKSPQNINQKVLFYKQPIIQKIANYFMKFMVKYDLKINEERRITLNVAQKLIESFFQIFTIEKIRKENMNLLRGIDSEESNKKVGLCLEFLIQQKKWDLVYEYLTTEIEQSLNVAHKFKGLDSFIEMIQESIETYDETFVDLVSLFVFYFVKFTKISPPQLIRAVNKSFKENIYQWNKEKKDQQLKLELKEKQKLTAKYLTDIAASITIQNQSDFQMLFKLVQVNKSQYYLKPLFDNMKLIQEIEKFSEIIIKEVQKINQTQKLEKQIQIIVDYCFNNLEARIFKLKILNDKVLKIPIMSGNFEKRCQFSHKLILNPLLKNFQQSFTETVKGIEKEISSLIAKKMNFKEISSFINKCFDFSIISAPGAEQIYRKFLLDQAYKQHFKKDNAEDFENLKGDYINWSNEFSYKNFVNSYILENVVKILFEKTKQLRKKEKIINSLKQLINKGKCSQQQKENLRYIIELDNIQLSKQFILKIISEQRQKLFVLTKIQADKNQQLLLQDFAFELTRKLENQQEAGKIYMNILRASKAEKETIEKIFRDKGIINIISEKNDMMIECFEKLSKVRSFIEILNNKYQLSDYERLMDRLLQSQTDTKQKELRFKDEIISITNLISDKILKCYLFSSFFKGQQIENITFEQAIQRCQELQIRFIQYRDRIIQQFNENQLTYRSVEFFKEELSREKQLKELFLININEDGANENDGEMIRQLLKTFTLINKVPTLIKAITGLIYFIKIDQTGRLTSLNAKLADILEYLNSILAKNPETNISKLSEKYNEFNKVVEIFKINKNDKLSLEDKNSSELLEFFFEISKVKKVEIDLLLSFKPEISTLKEKCQEDEENFLVDSDDLENSQTLITYLQSIYNQNHTNFRILIQKTATMIKQCPRLKFSYQVLKKINELNHEFKNVHKGDTKTVQKIYQIMKKCKVDLKFDSRINLKISLIIQEPRMMKQKRQEREIFEDEIKILKNSAILYLIQNNEKEKSKEQIEKSTIFDGFIKFLRNIDEIKQVWTQLQEWGYIIFKTQNKNTLDQRIDIVEGENKPLNDYVKKYKEIFEKWIQQMKELQKTSPKATLLQGENVRQFYQVLINRNQKKKVRFLNICQIEVLDNYINAKKYRPQSNPEEALLVIRDFFEYLKRIDKIEIKRLPDWEESYIKSVFMSEKDKDFIKGIIQLDATRIMHLDMTKILICVQDTTTLDIKTFIETAIRDETSEYVIIRPQRLSKKNQEFIIKKIEQHKRLNDKISLKLCLITNSYVQALYQYLKVNFKEQNLSVNKEKQQIQYKNLILEKSKNVEIVKSTFPGYGKTSYIVEKSKSLNRDCIFFPIAGAPTSEYIYQRFEQACQTIYSIYNEQKRYCSFIIQIHNIDPEMFEIVNTILQEIIMSRCIRYNGHFPQIIQQTLIFIELENIQSINDFNPLKTFTFLKELIQINDKLIYEINERPPINFKLWDEKKMQYIIQHLDYFDRNLIDRNQGEGKNLTSFNDFNSRGLDIDKANILMKKYFFDSMPESTYYQYQYFCSLLFSVCNNFSSSFGLSLQNLEYSFEPWFIRKLGLSTIRSGFFEVVLKNCGQFIGREISYQEFNYQNTTSTKKKLKKIPFLIIPNTDGESFSFIYKDHKSVPIAVRNFYLSQEPEFIKDIHKENLEEIFERHSIKKLEETNSKLFDNKIEQVLCNISGSKDYTINKDPNYIINIDNFFKMCLITLRQRQNIPITIMGEAGTGKTAILKHVSEKLYGHEFMTFNVNAGTKVGDLRKFLAEVEKMHLKLNGSKKIWVFFDQFNTLKEVGYMKEIIIDKRFEGKELPFLKDIVIMGACNPFRKLKAKNQNQAEASMIIDNKKQQQEEALAFHVLPPPHSMIECMWNYGALSSYEYEKYISKMILNIEYKNSDATKLLLKIHDYLANQFDSSFVSLRDIERFRTIYEFFNTKLPLNAHQRTAIYPGYDKREERALVMSFIFCYTLRIESDKIKKQLYKEIEKGLNLENGFVEKVKKVEETDFFHRLRIDYQSIASNSAIKQNIYCFFVAIYNKLPMIIVGPPGCSKSLAIRILIENMKGYNSEDKYLKGFESVGAINFQGSELCTSKQVEKLFAKATASSKNSFDKNQSILRIIVFDEIGLADKSKQNPLKVIHPYLEVSRELNLNNKEQNERNYAFLGISNTDLDISKMSRMLVLRRPQPTDQELKDTALGIARSFEYGKNEKILIIIRNVSEAFFCFIQEWHEKKNFRNFFSLRDFYSLIKCYLKMCQARQVNINQDEKLANLLEQAIFKNLNGGNESIELFMKSYCKVTQKGYRRDEYFKNFNVVQNMISCIEKQNLRFPLVIAKDKESLSYLVNLLINKFKKTTYFEKSPFANDKANTDYIIESTAAIIKTVGNGEKLILNNIEPIIQTSLYDMLNKFYTIKGDHNYCKISDVQSGMTKNTLVHKNFNCIFFLLSENLINVEAPFLSRFEKYSFSMEKISNFNIVESLAKEINIFKESILNVCKIHNMSHYKIESFFQNCNKDSLKTLILGVINESNIPIPNERSQQAAEFKKKIMDEVIFEMVMNSTQDFAMLYQYILEKQTHLIAHSNSIKKAIEKKKTFKVQQASETILFTTDKNVIYETSGERMQNKEAIKKLDLQTIKRQKDFDQSIETFLNSQQQKIIFIQLYKTDLDSIQYFISEVQKIKKQQQISKSQTYTDKRIIFFFELDRQQKFDKNQQSSKGISYFCQYRQIFYEGKFQIQNIKYDRTQFFNNIIDLPTVLTNIQEFFTVQIKSKDDNNNSVLLKKFKNLYNQLKNDKTNVLHRHLEEFIEKTEGINVSINQGVITEILSNPETLKNCKNFKEALTRQISSKSYYGVVAFFIKHLFEIDSFLTYSKSQIYQLNQVQSFPLKENTKIFIETVKQSQVYENNLKLLVTKKIDFLKNQYKKMKLIKRLPSAQKKFTAEIGRGRFIHFSKFENEMILSKQSGSLSSMALDKFGKEVNFEKELKVFRQQLHKKSSLVIKGDGQNKGENLYDLINRDNMMKELFVLELMIDFLEKKGINLKHIQLYMKLFKNLVALESSNQNKTLDLEYIIFVILALEQHLTFMFKLVAVFYDKEKYLVSKEGFFERNKIRDVKNINPQVSKMFFETLIRQQLSPILKSSQSIKIFGGSKNFFDIFTNCMLQIENLQKILKLEKPIQPILISIRDISRFVSEFSEQHKYELLEEFVKKLSQQKDKPPNIYSITFNFIQNLYIKSQTPEEKSLILKFQANKIFLQWFKDRPDDKDCRDYFIKKCDEDQIFCQNSMHVINYLLSESEINYDDITTIQEELKNQPKQLVEFARISKSKGFQNNLCILMVNIFLQKLVKINSGKSHPQIVNQNKRFLISIYSKLAINDIQSPLYQIFLYAFTKFVLISYAQTFISNEVNNDISELLDKDCDLSINSRLFCLKIFRKYLTPREIKDKFIKIKKMHWAPKIEKDFEEDKSRSLIVPKDFCNTELTNIFNEIQKSDGSAFNLFEQMLEYSEGFENRYSILNFFMRYYYTYSYNDKVYKEKTIQHFQTIRTKFEEKLGAVQAELIARYLNNNVSQHYKPDYLKSVNEEDLIQLNFFNLFLASKKSVSPLHSLFIENGELSTKIETLVKNQFSLSGPQNPFVSNAINTINLTRNNNIGVYLCCSDCDYIYTHEDCGWPRQQSDCPMCGQKIGRKDKSHSLSRDDKGARRLMHSAFVDKSAFYVWNMKELLQYWEVQRKYIEREIIRMKHKKSYTINLKKETVELTGLRVVDSGRISSFSFNILSTLIEILSYFLISLNVIKPNQVKNIFEDNTSQIALNRLHGSIQQTNKRIKSSLNLGNKFYGWSFGIQRNFIQVMNNFPMKFEEYQKSFVDEMEKLKINLNMRIAEKKIKSEYSNLYIEFVKTIDSGFFFNDILMIKDYTAANQFTRDLAQKLFEKLVSLNTDQRKFDFSIKYQTLQGKMQFPFDVFLTEDKIDEKKYNFYKIFKLPDQEITYNEIIVKYETFIKEKYPFLDYILKQSDLFIQMKNFYNVISYVNELHKEVDNRYERAKAEMPLIDFIQELREEKGNTLEKKLKQPQTMIRSWKQLSGFLGVLQNQCKIIGKMNNYYNQKTQLKAFLLDQSTKENVYGLMIASIFHNFAKMHNESMAVLNSRKNQIKAYNSLNLFNDLQKLHPQKIELQQIYTLDEEQLKRSLEQCSVASITYGQNYVYHNFDAFEEYFLKKLEGKCQIISNLKQFVSICYNGEAFSAQTEGSAVLSEIRQILDRKLSRTSLEKVSEFIHKEKGSGNFEKSVIQVRGDLEKIMLTLNSLKGNYTKEKSFSKIINEIQIGASSQELNNGGLSEIPICQIFDLYERLEDQLMYNVIKRLPEKYKQKFEKQTVEQVEQFLQNLPKKQNVEKPTLMQLESAIMKFTSRTLQNGIFDVDKLLIEFVTSRADFWPKDYPDEKTQALTYEPVMLKIKICHMMALIELINKVKTRS